VVLNAKKKDVYNTITRTNKLTPTQTKQFNNSAAFQEANKKSLRLKHTHTERADRKVSILQLGSTRLDSTHKPYKFPAVFFYRFA